MQGSWYLYNATTGKVVGWVRDEADPLGTGRTGAQLADMMLREHLVKGMDVVVDYGKRPTTKLRRAV